MNGETFLLGNSSFVYNIVHCQDCIRCFFLFTVIQMRDLLAND